MIGQIKKVGSDIMFHAITHANVHDVIALLNDNEVDVNCTNINGQTPLHVSTIFLIYQLITRASNYFIFALQSQSETNFDSLLAVIFAHS